MTTTSDHGRRVSAALPRTERPDAPAYLRAYLERSARDAGAAAGGARADLDTGGDGPAGDEGTPLYLRRFRARREGALDSPPPMWEGEDLGVTAAWADITRTKEIVPEDRAQDRQVVTQVHIVRHGETQGYSSESGLTPLGSWQAHRRGFDLSKSIRPGEQVRIVCADTNRARQTAEHIERGMRDGLVMWDRTADIEPVVAMPEFRNFQVATPEGLRDVTAAFRLYHKEMERYERVALGDRPMWLVELDRFWRTQQGGGDPIAYWTQIPMLHFEPPASTVRRFWAGIQRVVAESPGARVVCATHSGPMRVFAIWAFGYDPGEPYNTEEVLVRVFDEGRSALLAYRNRVQEVHVPDLTALPEWFGPL